MSLEPIPVKSPALSSLIGGGEHTLPEIARIEVDCVETDPDQPRQYFDEGKLQELADSIRRNGVDQPISVQRIGFERYRLLAGERRLRAAKIAGLAVIPALVRNDITNEEVELFRLRENVQREGLTPLEEARALRRIKDLTRHTWKEIAGGFGWKESTVLQKVKVLEAPERLQDLLETGDLSASHYSRLSSLPETRQIELAERVCKESLSFRDLREIIRQESGEEDFSSPPTEGDTLCEQSSQAGTEEEPSHLTGPFSGQPGQCDPESSDTRPPAPQDTAPMEEPEGNAAATKLTAKVTRSFHRMIRHRAADLSLPTVADYVRWVVENDLRLSGYLSDSLTTKNNVDQGTD
jgi:ParB family chromosome partitioning protein